jgi:hypothetical protein
VVVCTGERRYPLSAAIDRDPPGHPSNSRGATLDDGEPPLKQPRLGTLQVQEGPGTALGRRVEAAGAAAGGVEGTEGKPVQGQGVKLDETLRGGTQGGEGQDTSRAMTSSTGTTRQSMGVRNALRVLRMQHEVVVAPPVVDVG